MRGALAAIFLAIGLLGGCGGSVDDDVSQAPSDLARLVPANPFGVTEVDLAALKRALDLPAESDPGSAPESDADRRFASVAQAVVPFCRDDGGSPEPIDVAIRAAIDCAEIEAAAAPAGVGLWSLTIMRTEQPFEEIAESLTAAGYTRQGRLLGYAGGDSPMRYAEVVASADDESLIALARDRTAGFAALGEEVSADAAADARPELRALGALPAAPARTAKLSQAECIAAFALADRVEDERGELVVQLEANGTEPTAEGFALDRHQGMAGHSDASDLFDFDEPRVEGTTLHVGFDLRQGEARGSGVIAAFNELAFADPYECS